MGKRDLVTFEVDQQRAVRMAPQMPQGVVRVAGRVFVTGLMLLRSRRLASALLVGETLVKLGDPAREIQRLRGMG